MSAALLPKPTVRSISGAKKASTITPVSWKNTGIATANTSCGRYSRRVASRRNAPSSFLRPASAARTMASSSASTSASGPRTRRSTARARSTLPRMTRLMGVSVRKRAPTTISRAGAAGRPRERRQPQRRREVL